MSKPAVSYPPYALLLMTSAPVHRLRTQRIVGVPFPVLSGKDPSGEQEDGLPVSMSSELWMV
jgi:hypothetical protein